MPSFPGHPLAGTQTLPCAPHPVVRSNSVLSPQDTISWMPYVSIACVIIYVVGHALGPSMSPRAAPSGVLASSPAPSALETSGSRPPERPLPPPPAMASPLTFLSRGGVGQRAVRVTAVKRPRRAGCSRLPRVTGTESLAGGPGPLLGTSQDVTRGAVFLLSAFSRRFSASPGMPETPRSLGRCLGRPRTAGFRDPWWA